MIFACLIKTSQGIYWLATKDPISVTGFTSKKQGLQYFEDAYGAAHERGYEASMSACINWIFFQPSIIGFEKQEDMLPFYEGHPSKLSCVAGFITALTGKGDLQKLWDEGTKPDLCPQV